MTKDDLKASLSISLNEELADIISKNVYAIGADAADFKTWKRTFVGAYLLKFPACPQVVAYIAEALDVEVPRWEHFTKVNLIEVRNYICNKVSPNSAKTYCSNLSATLNDFKEEGLIPCSNVCDPLNVKKVPSQNTFLTVDEIELIHNYVPQTETERTVKRWFMVECYTGARTSDARLLTEQNIKGDKISYISGKTKIEAIVPIHRNLAQYLVVPKDEKTTHNRAVVNRTLKSICKRLGIAKEITLYKAGKSQTKPKWEFIGSHTARRSFATNLALAGEKIAVISAYMGHTNIEMTSKYIVIDTENIEASSYFN